MHSQGAASQHHLQLEQTLESVLQLSSIILSCWHEVVQSPSLLHWPAQRAGAASGPGVLLELQPLCSTFGANGAWTSTLQAEKRAKFQLELLQEPGTQKCPVPHVSLTVQLWMTHEFESCSLPAQAFVSYHNLALGLEREITTPFLKVSYCCLNPDKLEKGCQEVLNTFKAKFLQVSTQLQSTLSLHTTYRVEEHMHQ